MRMQLPDTDDTKYRSIVYHGKNSMTDMNLMMIGSTPLTDILPKTVTEEVPFADGYLDLSRIDGTLYFQSRSISYTFVDLHDFSSTNKPLAKNQEVMDDLNDIYEWLYDDLSNYTFENGYTLKPTELYDSAFGDYKFIDADISEVQVAKGMFQGKWITQITITFNFAPKLQCIDGDRVDLATFVDRTLTGTGGQTEMFVYTNNRYWLNDNQIFTNNGGIVNNDYSKWRFYIEVPYSGVIGIWLPKTTTIGSTAYPVAEYAGAVFISNDYPGQTFNSIEPTGVGAFAYVTPVASSTGAKYVTITVTYENTYTVEDPPYLSFTWGVIRNFSLPDQDHYIMDAYSKNDTAYMTLNWDSSTVIPFSEPFSLQSRSVNIIRVTNPQYDGLYKLRYDTTTRRYS